MSVQTRADVQAAARDLRTAADLIEQAESDEELADAGQIARRVAELLHG